MLGAYDQYKNVIDLAHGDRQAMELLEHFISASQDYFGAVALARHRGDNLNNVMSELYALNRYLRQHFATEFPDGFFAGTPEETEEFLGEILMGIYAHRQL